MRRCPAPQKDQRKWRQQQRGQGSEERWAQGGQAFLHRRGKRGLRGSANHIKQRLSAVHLWIGHVGDDAGATLLATQAPVGRLRAPAPSPLRAARARVQARTGKTPLDSTKIGACRCLTRHRPVAAGREAHPPNDLFASWVAPGPELQFDRQHRMIHEQRRQRAVRPPVQPDLPGVFPVGPWKLFLVMPPNKALHWTGIALRSIPASELGP